MLFLHLAAYLFACFGAAAAVVVVIGVIVAASTGES
jgi:hypothetical protein